jgi:hypothetical protein
MITPAPTVAVVICTYADDRWPILCEAIEALRAQTAPPDEIVVVVDHNAALRERVRRAHPDVVCMDNRHEQGLSAGRNTGVASTDAALVAFLDDDAIPARDWLEVLLAPFADPAVLVTGGFVEPMWESAQPAWFPDEFLWVVGCSYAGLPSARADTRNVFGGTMVVRRRELVLAGGFRTDVGRVGTVPLGGEETELCIRLRQRHPGARIVFEPAARIRHLVPDGRCTRAYFRRRCFHEGITKAVLTTHVGSDSGLSTERRYVTRTLPAGVVGGVRDALTRGRRGGAARAAMIVSGLAAAGAGYARGSLRLAALRRSAAGDHGHLVGAETALAAGGAPAADRGARPVDQHAALADPVGE